MNKVFYFLLTVLLLSISSCSKSSDSESLNNSIIESTCNKLKSGIVGTWLMDSHFRTETSSAALKLGWDDATSWEKEAEYKFIFDVDGKFTDNAGNNSTYSIYLDENKNVKHSGEIDCWPFRTGAIYLKFNSNADPFYYNSYFAEIKDDGKLYLYNTVDMLGGEGIPKYRYKKQ